VTPRGTSGEASAGSVGVDHGAATDLHAVDSERTRWYELFGLVRRLSPDECLEPGYYEDPAWSVRDLIGHVGTWLAQGEIQLMRINAGTYEGHAVDIDALNAQFLEAVRDQSWDTVSDLAQAGRTRMLQEWSSIETLDDEATWWLRKSGADHYAEHLERLRVWVDELVERR
jgi:hypothetical protein